MSIKQGFLDAWDNRLPNGVKDFATTAIPALVESSTPYDAENPTRNAEILSHNLNLIFKQFEGFTFVDLILHIGQRNQINKLAAMASYAANPNQEPYDFTIDSPEPDKEYSSGIVLFSITVTGGVSDAYSASVTIGAEVLEMQVDENDPSIWTAGYGFFNTESQEFTATIEVVYVAGSEEYQVSNSITFSAYSGA